MICLQELLVLVHGFLNLLETYHPSCRTAGDEALDLKSADQNLQPEAAPI